MLRTLRKSKVFLQVRAEEQAARTLTQKLLKTPSLDSFTSHGRPCNINFTLSAIRHSPDDFPLPELFLNCLRTTLCAN